MCPVCIVMATMVAAGVASSGALSVLIAKTLRSKIDARTTIPTVELKEKDRYDIQYS
jgi:hypothetical protein